MDIRRPSQCPFPLGSIRALVWLHGDEWWFGLGRSPETAAQCFQDAHADEHAMHYCAWAWRTLGRAEAIGRSAAIKLDPPDLDEIQRHVMSMRTTRIHGNWEVRLRDPLRKFWRKAWT